MSVFQGDLLTVTAAHIEASRSCRTLSTLDRQNPNYDSIRDCPIGIALAEHFKAERDTVSAHPDFLRIGRLYGSASAPLPRYFEATAAIREYMRQWDRHGRALPHRFRLIPRQ